MKKLYLFFVVGIILCLIFSITVNADPYQNYIYDSEGKAQAEPQAYMPTDIITGESLGVGAFKEPKNVFVTQQEELYIVDTGNNRIIVTDKNYVHKKTVDSFTNNGMTETFNLPHAIFVTDRLIYVADTGNQRIIIFDKMWSLKQIIGKPESKLITEEFKYEPINLSVDSAGRIFVISNNVNNGVIELTPDGEFVGFIGAVKVKLSFVQAVWRLIATNKQRERMQLSLPTQYASIDIDDNGFLYCTVSAVNEENFSESMFICRLNPMGNDVLKRNGFNAPMGDVEIEIDEQTLEKKYSSLADVVVRNSGIYSVLDQKMGRVFTYNSNGELMYVFGGFGSNKGQFKTPTAIETFSDKRMLVVDSGYNWISVFEPTDYGKLINGAVENFYNRNYEEADELWNEALQYTAKSSLAFDGVGRSYVKKGEYEDAMAYLRIANDKPQYSSAFEKFRAQQIAENFDIVIVCVIVITVIIVAISFIKKMKKKGKLLWKK